jgi:hypothetical protein
MAADNEPVDSKAVFARIWEGCHDRLSRFLSDKSLHEHQGLNVAQIANALSLDPYTVAYWLRQEPFRLRKSSLQTSKLDPFKPQRVRMLENTPIEPHRSSNACASKALTAAIGLSKPMGDALDPNASPLFSHAPLPRASVPRSIGARLVRSGSDKPEGGKAALSWCCATAA